MPLEVNYLIKKSAYGSHGPPHVFESTTAYFGTGCREEGEMVEGVSRPQWMLDPSHYVCLEEGWTVLLDLRLSSILLMVSLLKYQNLPQVQTYCS